MKRILRTNRGIVRVSGPDSRTFLQGLISNDVTRADGTQAVYAALLTPQGKYLFDFFIVAHDGALLLDCLAEDIDALVKRLSMFKLRSKVELADARHDFSIFAFFGDDTTAQLELGDGQRVGTNGIVFYPDPRLAKAGARAIVPVAVDVSTLGGDETSEDEYQRHRIGLGLPEAPLDLQKDKSILLEAGFDELAGVDWKKGCYMGQELTARTKYRGLIKKRLVPVRITGGAGVPGTDIMCDGKTVGDLRSVAGDLGMAMLRLDAIRGGAALDVGGATANPLLPDWFELPISEAEAEGA